MFRESRSPVRCVPVALPCAFVLALFLMTGRAHAAEPTPTEDYIDIYPPYDYDEDEPFDSPDPFSWEDPVEPPSDSPSPSPEAWYALSPRPSPSPSPAARANPDPKYAKEGTVKVEYKKVKQGRPLHMHFFLPKRADPSEALPAIVLFPGGGWSKCNVTTLFPHAKYFASRGMVAAVAEYRVKSTHSSSNIFDSVADAKSAVRWMRTHARELGVDPNQIVGSGGSAGGHVVACAGIVPGQEEAGENTLVSSRPDYLVLFNPVVAFKPNGAVNRRYKERANAINPSKHVKEGAPPTVIFHGTRDTTVPISGVERFEQLMKNAGTDCVLHKYEGKSHGCYRGAASYGDTVEKADRFLARHNVLSGEPTIAGATEKAPPAKPPVRPRPRPRKRKPRR